MVISLNDKPIVEEVKKKFPDWNGNPDDIDLVEVDRVRNVGGGIIVTFCATFKGERAYENVVLPDR